MIRYAASTTSRTIRARSFVAVNGGDHRFKSSPARQEEPWEETAIEQQQPPRRSSSSPPRFQSNRSSWKDRLEQHYRQSTSSWRSSKDQGLSDFFKQRRNGPPAASRPPSFSPRNQQSDDKQSYGKRPAWRGRSPAQTESSSPSEAASIPRPSPTSFSQQHNDRQQSNGPPQSKRPTWRRPPTRTKESSFSSRPTFASQKNKTIENDLTKGSLLFQQKESDKVKDMADVSDLRAAFLKTVQAHWKDKDKQQQKTSPPLPNPTMQKSAWRNGGAKAFRQQQEQRRKEEAEKKAQAWRARQSTKTFFLSQEEKQEQEALQQQQQETLQVDKQVVLPKDGGDVHVLSSLFRVGKQRVIQILEELGEKDVHQDGFKVDVDTMELVALELGMEPVRDTRRGARRVEDDRNLLLQRRAVEEEAATLYESFPPRPPVVACMGHVDHGKTTLMDALRRKSKSTTNANTKSKKKKSKKSKSSNNEKGDVAGTEAGGITQVISAFQIALENSERGAVTFLDTPGHAAFRSMRESGSHAADVIVLVVAADDGVSPQTVEILDFYKSIIAEAGSGAISLVVAMTKIDKPGIDVDESRMRIENQLLEHGIVTENMAASSSNSEEEFGPPVQLIPVSGLTGDGLDDLIEGLELQSEVMDLRADQEATAEGIVMDARIEKGLGVVADCIVRWGSLERGNVVVSGIHSGKVKALKDVNGKTLKKGIPSQPVRIIGFESLPKAGDPVICVSSEEKAKRLVEKREEHLESDPTATFRMDSADGPQFQVTGTASKTASMQQMAENKYEIDGDSDDTTIRIPVIIKADADGTLAAVRDSLLQVGSMSSTYNLIVDPVGMGIGPILTSDVALAQQSGAAIFSFGLDKLNDKSTMHMAEGEGVTIRSHDVIYSLLDDAKDVFAQHLPPAPVEVVHGSATVQAVFDINNKRNAEKIAGLKVMDGTLYKSKVDGSKLDCHYRVVRNGERITPEGEKVRASSLRRVKEDVEDVRRGDECGLGLDGFDDVQEGDTIECYSVEMKRVFV